MDINALFTDDGLRSATSAWRDTEMRAASEYGQFANIFEARLKTQQINGDHWWSARLRARRVARHLKTMQKARQKAAASAEALHGDFVNKVLELPARRENAQLKAEEKKERRALAKGATAAAVANSLTKSAAALTSDTNQQVTNPPTAVPQAPQYVPAQHWNFAGSNGSQPLPDLADLFQEGQQTG